MFLEFHPAIRVGTFSGTPKLGLPRIITLVIIYKIHLFFPPQIESQIKDLLFQSVLPAHSMVELNVKVNQTIMTSVENFGESGFY